jgi:murein L,D-transpeptidase YafK
MSIFWVVEMNAQNAFIANQKSNPRVLNAFKNKNDSLKKQFERAHLSFPPKQIYLRSFKYDSQLEVWVKPSNNEPFVLFKTYPVCALSGTIGPKRMNGDYQVPEGFYYINEFNPNSSYHLSLGINYPNISDNFLSDSIKPGNEIYIHGKCVTQGCIPIQDEKIEELYILAAYAHSQGQDFIPVHIFPVRFDSEKSIAFFKKNSKYDPEYQRFANRLKEVYHYFETSKRLPVIAINTKGEYRFY